MKDCELGCRELYDDGKCDNCPSDESGDRRQDAANDRGSRKSNGYHVREIVDLYKTFGTVNAVAYLEKLLSEVSARSADSRVLEQVIAYVEAWADQKRHDAKEQKARHFTQGSVRTLGDAKLLGRLAVAIREKFQNQT